jgi:hypothetical protein
MMTHCLIVAIPYFALAQVFSTVTLDGCTARGNAVRETGGGGVIQVEIRAVCSLACSCWGQASA